MMKRQSLRFEVEQLAELRSFEKGYRGAWFRCKIKKVVRKKGQVAAYTVEYYDYPDDPEEMINIYGYPLKKRSHKGKKELVLRPHFPEFYNESELPDLSTIGEVIVAIADVWRVGDLVDWFSDGCFWCGTITEVIEGELVKVELLKPPKGEGSSYVVKCKDLRPALDWSPEHGWIVPVPSERQNEHMLARLIRPTKQAPLSKSVACEIDEDKQNLKVTPRSSLDCIQSFSSYSGSSLPLLNRSTHSKDSLQSKDISTIEMQKTHGVNVDVDVDVDVQGSAIGKHSSSDNFSGTYVQDASAEVPVATCAEEQGHKNGSAKKMRFRETTSLNSSACDSIDSAVLDLEELVNRVKWLKQILKLGISSTPKDPTWEFLEHSAVGAPK